MHHTVQAGPLQTKQSDVMTVRQTVAFRLVQINDQFDCCLGTVRPQQADTARLNQSLDRIGRRGPKGVVTPHQLSLIDRD